MNKMNSVKTDHVQTISLFTLSSVIQNRLHKNIPTFAAFLDIEKELLRLLEYGVDGKMYNSIQKMYDDNKSSTLLAPAVTVGETEGAMDSASSSFAYNFVRK